MKQAPITHAIKWDGRIVCLSYRPEYFGNVAHLEIRSSDGEPLPMTSTGYKSHFFMSDNPPCLEEVISFVTDWINEDAKSKSWQKYSECSKQLCLF